jgi:hypothetical protein
MNRFEFSRPAQMQFNNEDVIVTDPCYYIPDKIWHELIAAWYPPSDPNGTEYSEQGVIEFDNGAHVLYSSTAYGDGEYPMYVNRSTGKSVHSDKLGVDAGMISVVSVSDLKKLERDYGYTWEGKPFDLDRDYYPRVNGFTGRVYADGKGNFLGDIEVPTMSETQEEDYNGEGYDEFH